MARSRACKHNIETMIDKHNSIVCRDVNGFLHKKGLPAVVCGEDYQAWWSHGRRHRFEGPAIVRRNGETIEKFYYWFGKLVAVNSALSHKIANDSKIILVDQNKEDTWVYRRKIKFEF